jgi:hypothetical protein
MWYTHLETKEDPVYKENNIAMVNKYREKKLKNQSAKKVHNHYVTS